MHEAVPTIAPRLSVGMLTPSFPVPGYPASGVFVQRLAEEIGRRCSLEVHCPLPDSCDGLPPARHYRLQGWIFAPRAWRTVVHSPGGLPQSMRNLGIRSVVPLVGLVVTMFLVAWRLAGRSDVVHANWSLAGAIAGLVCKLRGRPLVTTLRGDDVNGSGGALSRGLLRCCLALSDRVVVVSQAMATQLSREYPSKAAAISFIANGVALQAAPPEPHEGRPLRLLVLGSLIERKDVATVLQALSRVQLKPAPELCIVGDGPLRGELQALASRLGLQGRVRFFGMVAPDAIWLHLAWCDVMVLASRSEGRPNVVLEAMACARPVLASDIAGTRELIGTSRGWLFPPGDFGALAELINRVGTDPKDRLDTGQRARDWLDAKGLSWAASADEYMRVYRTVLDQRARPCAA